MHFIPLLTLPISLAPFAPIHQPGVKAPTPFARPRSSPGHQPTTRYQGSIKAKTPAIKANRASSRHIKARPEIINWGSRQPSPMWSAATCLPVPKRSHACALHIIATNGTENSGPGKGQSRLNQGKKPCNRASSRLIKASAKNQQRHHAIGSPSQNRAPQLGRAEVPLRPIYLYRVASPSIRRTLPTTREFPLPPSPFAASRLRLCVKTPAIVHDQGSSCLIKANEIFFFGLNRPFTCPHAFSSAFGCWVFSVGCWMFPNFPPSAPQFKALRL